MLDSDDDYRNRAIDRKFQALTGNGNSKAEDPDCDYLNGNVMHGQGSEKEDTKNSHHSAAEKR